jgi:hypothetical protein
MILFIISHFQGVIKIFFKHIPLPPQILPLGNGDEGAKNENTPLRGCVLGHKQKFSE